MDFVSNVTASVVGGFIVIVLSLIGSALLKKYEPRWLGFDWTGVLPYVLQFTAATFVIYVALILLGSRGDVVAETASSEHSIITPEVEEVVMLWMKQAGLEPKPTDPQRFPDLSFEYEVRLDERFDPGPQEPIYIFMRRKDVGGLITTEVNAQTGSADCWTNNSGKELRAEGVLNLAIAQTGAIASMRSVGHFTLSRYIPFEADQSAAWFLVQLGKLAMAESLAIQVREQACSELR